MEVFDHEDNPIVRNRLLAQQRILGRRWNLRHGDRDEEDPVRMRRQRHRAQFLLLVALFQVWLAFMKLINRNQQRNGHNPNPTI